MTKSSKKRTTYVSKKAFAMVLYLGCWWPPSLAIVETNWWSSGHNDSQTRSHRRAIICPCVPRYWDIQLESSAMEPEASFLGAYPCEIHNNYSQTTLHLRLLRALATTVLGVSVYCLSPKCPPNLESWHCWRKASSKHTGMTRSYRWVSSFPQI